ncbi:sporulation protein [Fictibacillus fluitans]|uniref:Sporulation protein n=1 Tax=Fictibacillus fluitans TaxID=3058422 RepID=A0ABT8HVC1_9BACL|nr:sporulation protein [Fictibacillus sp. NE201]MDN4524727.1 sporulation protein [Fictibacillus sp. NE201]
MNKMLASIGIGAATVDTILNTNRFIPGEEISGTVQIIGGKAAQPVDSVSLFLMTEYIRETDDKKIHEHAVVARHKVTDHLVIQPGETKRIPFVFRLPFDVPLSIGHTPVWLKTGVDIKNAVDPSDKDFITVNPGPLVSKAMEAIEGLDFFLRKAKCEAASRYNRGRLPFIQEFEYVPTGMFRGKLDELEAIFLSDGKTLEILLEIDKKANGLFGMLEEAMDMDEKHIRLSFTEQELQNPSLLSGKLTSAIQQFV